MSDTQADICEFRSMKDSQVTEIRVLPHPLLLQRPRNLRYRGHL